MANLSRWTERQEQAAENFRAVADGPRDAAETVVLEDPRLWAERPVATVEVGFKGAQKRLRYQVRVEVEVSSLEVPNA